MDRTIAQLSVRLALSEFLSRHEASILGLFWYLLNPTLTFIILYMIFAPTLGADVEHYAMYLLIGVIFFRFFERVVVESTRIVRANAQLIKSIPFPKVALIYGVVGQYAISMMIELGILLVIGIISGVGSSTLLVALALPVIIATTTGAALIITPLAVYIRDLEDITRFGTWLLFFATPIFYTPSSWFHTINPLAAILEWTRTLVLEQMLAPIPTLWSVLFAIIVLYAGNRFFNAQSARMSQWL